MPRSRQINISRKLAQYVRYAYAHSPAIRRIFDDAEIKPSQIRRVSDLERVPVTSKDRLATIQAEHPPFGGFLATNPRNIRRIFQSPGPIYEPVGSDESLDRIAADVFRIAGFRRDDVVLNTLSYHLSPGGWILDGGLQYLGATVIPSGVGNSELQVKLLLDLNISGYAGTPSFLMTILEKAEEIGISVTSKLALRRALFTAEPYPPSLRARFESAYGLKTTNAYATAELGFLAHDCEADQGLHFVDGPVIQICDPGTGKQVASGEVGQVVVTTFNKTYPTIRLGTGDLATFVGALCTCGRKSPRLMLVGRVGDAVKVRGMFVHPNQLLVAMKRFPAILGVQGVVTRPDVRDNFTLRVHAEGVHDYDTLGRNIAAAVRELCRVGVDEIEFVPQEKIVPGAKTILDERQWK